MRLNKEKKLNSKKNSETTPLYKTNKFADRPLRQTENLPQKTTPDKHISKADLLEFFGKYQKRVELLGDEQRAFVRLFVSIQNYRALAIIAKVNEATIARRLIKIAKHLLSSNFITALINDKNMDSQRLEILRDHYAKCIAASKIAKQRNIPICRVRRIIRELK